MTGLHRFVPVLMCCAVLTGHAAETTEEPAVDHKAMGHSKSANPLFRYSYDLSIADDDNIRRAQNEVDIRADLVTSFTLNAKGGVSIDKLSLLNFGASATYEAYDTFSDLNNLNFNLNARYRFAFSSGFTSAIYALGIKLGGIESELEMRDSTWFSVAFEMNKRLTSTINTTIGLNFKKREATSEVFDTTENHFFINMDVELSKKTLIYGTYTLITGDIVSSGTPTLQFINLSDAVEPDDAFGGVTFNQFAYRLDAETNVITLGYNRVMTPSMSVDISYRFVDTEAVGAIFYERQILRASLLGRF